MLESVVNVSEGRDEAFLASLRQAAGEVFLDLHRDPDHHRAVLTLAGEHAVEDAVQALTRITVEHLDLRAHQGVHPRFGVVDVVPWVDLDHPSAPATDRSLAARDRFAEWAGRELSLPCFLYGPERSLPDVRRTAWRELAPDTGPQEPHPTAGAAAVGARGVLVAYNLWLAGADRTEARRVAAAVRRAGLRTLGLSVGDGVQVSCNLVDPYRLGLAEVHDLVASMTAVDRAELVGLLPRAVLDAIPAHRWAELGVGPARTIEARLEAAAGRGRGRLPGGGENS